MSRLELPKDWTLDDELLISSRHWTAGAGPEANDVQLNESRLSAWTESGPGGLKMKYPGILPIWWADVVVILLLATVIQYIPHVYTYKRESA
jgi:hypothetical protein